MAINDISTPLYTIIVGGANISSSTSTTMSIGSSVPLFVTASLLGATINASPYVTASIVSSIPLFVTASILNATFSNTSSISGPVIISGYSLDNTPLTGSPILNGAKVVDAPTYTPTYTTNSIASLAVDKTSGALLVSQGNLIPTADGIGFYGTDGAIWRAASVISASSAKSSVSQVLLVQPIDDHGQIGSNVGGFTLCATSSFVRPSAPNTASYVSGEVVSTGSTNVIPNVVRVAGGSGTILNATLIDGANQPNLGNYEVYLFRKNRVSEADSTFFSASYVDAQNIVCVIPFSPSSSYVVCSGSKGTTIYTNQNVLQSFVCLPLTSSLYWNLVVRNSYAPISNEQFTLTLNIAAD